MRIATLNMWGIRGDWPARRAVLREGFGGWSPDVVTFQEAITTADYRQAADVLGPDYRIVEQTKRETDGQGVSTATRWPVGEVVEVDLHVSERTAGFACTSLITELFAPAPIGRVLVVNNLPSWRLALERERELQAVRTARAVEEMLVDRPAHVIVAGDFDADPTAASVRFWCGRQSLEGFSVCYRDAWESVHPTEPGHTYVPDNGLSVDWDWPFRRIDYVLVRCGHQYGGPTLRIVDCVRLFDEPVHGVWASDHFGVLAELEPAPT
ncbi:MAG TPA: endonuclease/exonuclease/phosphatase family protein [Pseudonocardiaceae bacterium]|nr:endonuclease/exonuclease/phosphatase family protein [Pseudonocardiaceae bacterium]